MRKGRYISVCFALLLLSLLASGCEPAKPKVEFQKGMCYATWSKERYATIESDKALEELAKSGTKWVSVVATWYQAGCSTTSILPTDNTPSDSSVIHAIKKLHSLGIKVMLKPHIDVLDETGGNWRGEIACDPSDWTEWFENYKKFILHYAKLAEENKVEIFCTGTELSSVVRVKGDMWKEHVIKPVKSVYKGRLTYAANWDTEYLDINFWDELDYVGIDAYFPLTDVENPTIEDIKSGWDKWSAELEKFQATVNKPLIFTEVGYASIDGIAKTPWDGALTGKLNLKLQADCYEALFEALWDKEWFYGAYCWKWGTDVRFGGLANKGFSIQNKPALDVVSKWYHKPAPLRKKLPSRKVASQK